METGKVLTSRDVVFDERNRMPGAQLPHQAIDMAGSPHPQETILTHHQEDINSQLPRVEINEGGQADTHNKGSKFTQNITPQPELEFLENHENDIEHDTDNDIEDTVVVRAPSTISRTDLHTPPTAHHLTEEGEPSGENNHPSRRLSTQRPQRIRKPVDLFKPAPWKAMTARTNEEPQTLEEALVPERSVEWRAAWDSEVQSLKDNGTWVLENLPPGRKAIECQWIFKIKEDGRFKARLVAKGYS